MDFLGSLRGDEQVEAELPPLSGDLDGTPGRQFDHSIVGPLRADVVGFADDDEHRLVPATKFPERVEHAVGRHGLLLW
ncbi:MAG: hypothetical protein ABSC41_00600 [Acidimicrobiales bacterium]